MGPVVRSGYLRPDQFLDHLTVKKRSRVITSEATARQSPVKGLEITPPGGGLEERRKSNRIF